MTTNRELLVATRAAAIFTSHLAIGSRPTGREATAIISAAVRAHGGTRGCAAAIAAASAAHAERRMNTSGAEERRRFCRANTWPARQHREIHRLPGSALPGPIDETVEPVGDRR